MLGRKDTDLGVLFAIVRLLGLSEWWVDDSICVALMYMACGRLCLTWPPIEEHRQAVSVSRDPTAKRE